MENINFNSYWSGLTKDQKEQLATDADTSVPYLNQVASGHRNAGAKLIEKLIKADPVISFQMMRAA